MSLAEFSFILAEVPCYVLLFVGLLYTTLLEQYFSILYMWEMKIQRVRTLPRFLQLIKTNQSV